MKQTKYILSFIISVILTSCDGLPHGGIDIDGAARSKEVKMSVSATRGIVDSNGSVGVFMHADNSLLYSNVQYIMSETDVENIYTLNATNENDKLLYPTNGNTVDICAYYPHSSNLAGTEYFIDNWNNQYTEPLKCDLFVARVQGSINDKGVVKKLDFHHAFSRIEFNISVAPDCMLSEEDLYGLQMNISNINQRIGFDIVNNKINYYPVYADNKTLNIPVDDYGTYAYALVPPPESETGKSATGRRLTIHLTSIDRTMFYDIPDDTVFEPGKKYTWKVKVSSNDVDVTGEEDEDIPYGGEF